MRRRHFLQTASILAVPALFGGCALPVREDVATAPRARDPWLDAFDVDDAALGRVRRALGRRGGAFGEVFFQAQASSEHRVAAGTLVGPQRKSSVGAALRVVRDEAVGFAASGDLSEPALLAAAGRAAGGGSDAATGVVADIHAFVPPGSLYEAPATAEAQRDARVGGLLDALDRNIRGRDAAVSNVDASLSFAHDRVLIATLDGRLLADHRPMTRLSVQVTMTRNGESLSGFASIAGRHDVDWYDDERIGRLIDRALQNTDILFDARRAPEGELPVLLAAGTSGSLLHESLGHAFEADFVARGLSPYAADDSAPVASSLVTIVDDATIAGERGALHVDDEGEAGRRNLVVENGRLRSLLHDKRTAAAFGVEPTGTGRRASWRHEPLPRMTTTYLANGQSDPAELQGAMDRGIVAEAYAGGSVSLGGGDFVFRVRHGWYVEDGVRRVPIRDFELVGNGPQLLRDISLVGNDFRFDEAGWLCGKSGQSVPVSHGMPSVLVASLGARPLA